MIVSNESNNKITFNYLNDCYCRNFCYDTSDNVNTGKKVIDSLIAVVEGVKKNPDYNGYKNTVREFFARKIFEEAEKYCPDTESAAYIAFMKNADAVFFCYPLFLNVKETDFEDIKLYEKVAKGKERAKIRHDFSYLPEIIVSMTSFPGRIDTVYKSLKSVFSQSFKADRIILWLAEEQFPEKKLPDRLMEYVQLGLEIRWCDKDLRPHKKYFYAMQEFPDALIITVDDDLIYDKQMIEMLVTSYLHFPGAVSATRTHLMTADLNGNIAPYMQWGNQFSGVIGKPSMQLFSTSGAGTLYPPDCMDNELFNVDNIRSLCLNADDLWFKVMQVRKGTPVVLVKANEELVYVPGSQEEALHLENRGQNGNDIQLAKILDVYDRDNAIVKTIFEDNYTVDSQVCGIDVFKSNDYGLLDASDNYMNLAEKNEALFIEYRQKYYKTNHNRKKAEEKCVTLTENIKIKTEEINSKKKEINLLQQQKNNLENKLADALAKKSERETRYYKTKGELEGVKNSLSYKIGLLITYIPRKIRKFLKR